MFESKSCKTCLKYYLECQISYKIDLMALIEPYMWCALVEL